MKDAAANTTTVRKGSTTIRTDAVETSFLTFRHYFRMDWEDACSLDYLQDLNRYFSLIINKGTEHFVSFPAEICASQLALLKNSTPSLAESSASCEQTMLRNSNLKRSSTIVSKTMLCAIWLQHIITQCKPMLRVPLASSNSTAKHLCCTLASSAVSGMTRPEISAS